MSVTPSFSKGGIDVFEFGAMKDFKIVHHCLEDKESDLSLLDSDTKYAFLDSLIIETTLLRRRLNLSQWFCKLVCFALRYALLRFRICLFIAVVIHGGSDGRIITFLFGINDSVILDMQSVRFLA